MKKFLKNYGWLLKIVSAIFVIVLAIVFITNNDSPKLIIYTVAGIVILLGIIRIVPLLKTLNNPVLRIVNAFEIVFDLGVGVALIIIANTKNFDTTPWFGYLAGAVLYLRALVHLFSVVIYQAKSDKLMFWFSIIIMTAGVYVASNSFSSKDITWFLFALALVCALYLAGDGYFHYRRYRLEMGKISLKTKKSKKPKEEIIGDKQSPIINEVPDKKDDHNQPTIVQ